MQNITGTLPEAIVAFGVGNSLSGVEDPQSSYILNGEVVSGSKLILLYEEAKKQLQENCFDYVRYVEDGLGGRILTNSTIDPALADALSMPTDRNFSICVVPTTQYSNRAPNSFDFSNVNWAFNLSDANGNPVLSANNPEVYRYNKALENKSILLFHSENSIDVTYLYKIYVEQMNSGSKPEYRLSFEEFLKFITQGLPGDKDKAEFYQKEGEFTSVSDDPLHFSQVQIPTTYTIPGTVIVLPLQSNGNLEYTANGIQSLRPPFDGVDGPNAIHVNRMLSALAQSVIPDSNSGVSAENYHLKPDDNGPLGLVALAILVITFIKFSPQISSLLFGNLLKKKEEAPSQEAAK